MIKYTLLELIQPVSSLFFSLLIVFSLGKVFNSKKIYFASVFLTFKWIMDSLWFIIKIVITIVLLSVPPSHIHTPSGKIIILKTVSAKRFALSDKLLAYFDQNNIYFLISLLFYLIIISTIYYTLFYAKKYKKIKWYILRPDIEIYFLLIFALPLILNYLLHIFNIHIHNKFFEITVSTILMIVLMPKKIYKAKIQVKNKKLGHNTLQAVTMFIAYFTSLFIAIFDIGLIYDLDCLAFIFIIYSLATMYTSIIKINIEDKISSKSESIINFEVFLTETNKYTKISNLISNETYLVKHQSIIPVDSILKSNNAYISYENINGESQIIELEKGDIIPSGAINKSQEIVLLSNEDFKSSYLSTIYEDMTKVNYEKTKVFSSGQKYIRWIIYSIVICTFLDLFYWIVINHNINAAINTSVSIILLTCPCGIGTGLPVLFSKYLSNMLNSNIYVRNLNTIDITGEIDTIIFDKTGTLTSADFNVEEMNNVEQYKNIIYSLEIKSSHPLSKTITKELKDCELIDVEKFEEVFKKGISGIINNKKYYIGNSLYLKEILNIKIDDKYTILFTDDDILASFVLTNNESINLEKNINKLNKEYTLSILSGDMKQKVEKLANKLNIKNYFYSKSSEEKKLIVSKINQRKKTLYVGDGLNDTLAAGEANISMSFKHGSSINNNYSDVILINHDLSLIYKYLKYTSYTNKLLISIILFTLICNFIFIGLASLNIISMGLAPLGEVFTTIFIILFVVVLTSKK